MEPSLNNPFFEKERIHTVTVGFGEEIFGVAKSTNPNDLEITCLEMSVL